MPTSRTRSSRPLMRTRIVSPSTTRARVAVPGAVCAEAPLRPPPQDPDDRATTAHTMQARDNTRASGIRCSFRLLTEAAGTAIGERSVAFEDGAGAEPATTAHGDEPDGPVDALELVEGARDQPGAGAADRVAEGDGATVGVDGLGVGGELTLPREHHRCERLVDLDGVDVGHGDARARQELVRRIHRSGEHEHRVDADEALGGDAGAGGEPEDAGSRG